MLHLRALAANHEEYDNEWERMLLLIMGYTFFRSLNVISISSTPATWSGQ